MTWQNNDFEETRKKLTLTGDAGDASVGQPPGATLIIDRPESEIIVEMSIEEAFALRDMLNSFLDKFIEDDPAEINFWEEDLIAFPDEMLPFPEDDIESMLMAAYESYNESWEDF
jgi:hypothetical protein